MARMRRDPLGLRRGFTLLATTLALALGGLGMADVYTPARVDWQQVEIEGLVGARAEGLVLQDRIGDDVFASMGFSIYRSRAGGPFERLLTVVPTPSEAWAGYSRTFRQTFRYQEMVEVAALSQERLVVFAGGEVFRVDLEAGTQERVHTLRYYGRGEGRGLMPHGVTVDETGTLYYGEYPTRKLRPDETVRIWRSRDGGRTFEVAHEFAPGSVRHVHAVQWDPHADALWVATGDTDPQARIGYSTDGGRTFTWIGSGSQTFRTCSLLFFPDRVVWAMDAPAEDSRVLTWDRESGRIAASETVLPSPAYYTRALADGRGLVTLAEREASLWLVDRGEEPRPLLRWDARPDPSLPHPSVRLARSHHGRDAAWVLLNPLRTESDSSSIFRVGLAGSSMRVAAANGPRPVFR